MNIKKLSCDAASNILNSWLDKCGKLRPLELALKYCSKNGNRPLKLDTLKMKNELLYDILQ
jgi:hypothetical protein